jgi:hypothetical protein
VGIKVGQSRRPERGRANDVNDTNDLAGGLGFEPEDTGLSVASFQKSRFSSGTT